MDYLDKAKQFYDLNIKGYLLGDLKKSHKAATNYLTALGCLVGTEVIGTMLPKLESEKGSSKSKRFYRCLYRLSSGTYLENLDKVFVTSTRNGIYVHLRHNMAHMFLPKVSTKLKSGKIILIPFTIAQRITLTDLRGTRSGPPIFYDHSMNVLAISVQEYEEQLKNLVDFAYKKTFEENDENYIEAAIEGIKHINNGF